MSLKTRLRALENRDTKSTTHIVLRSPEESVEAAMAAYNGHIGPNDNTVFLDTGIPRRIR